jgi:hypothetical protein
MLKRIGLAKKCLLISNERVFFGTQKEPDLPIDGFHLAGWSQDQKRPKTEGAPKNSLIFMGP